MNKHPSEVTKLKGGAKFYAIRIREHKMGQLYPHGGGIEGRYLDFTGEWVDWFWEFDGSGGNPDLDLDWNS